VFVRNLADTLQESPIGQFEHTKAKMFNDAFGHGNFLNPEEIKEKYPNIVEKYPQGGSEFDVKFDSDLKDSHDLAIDAVNRMKPGAMSKLASWGGSIAGFALSPSTWISGGVTTRAAKFAENALVNSALYRSVFGRLITKFTFRTGEGAAMIAPFTVAEQHFYKEIDEKAPPWWQNIVFGGLMGGGIGTLFGLRQIFHPKIMDQAFETAANQVATGKQIHIEPLIKQAQYEASKEWPENEETIQNAIDDAEKKLPALADEEKQEWQDKIDSTKLYQEIQADKPQPPTKEELQDSVKKMTSWETNIDTDLPKYEKAQEMLKQPDKPVHQELRDLDDEVKTLKENNLLDDDGKAWLNKADFEQTGTIKTQSALRDYVSCITKKLKRGE
jgi:hypothetical protein